MGCSIKCEGGHIGTEVGIFMHGIQRILSFSLKHIQYYPVKTERLL